MLQKHFRYPALAEANKALICLEEEVTNIKDISHEMEMYKQAQAITEKKRDLAFIPIYFALERYVLEHQPPAVKNVYTREQIREKVKSRVQLDQMTPMFHLIFSADNEQADHFLKIGAVDLMQLLLTGLGQNQLQVVVQKAATNTPLALIKITDDGILFTDVHPKFQAMTKADVVAAYQQLYKGLYDELKSFFGELVAKQQALAIRQKFEKIYSGGGDLLSLVTNVLPND